MKIRLATFNLETLDDRTPGFEDRLALLRPQFQRLEADILCLQEVNAVEDSKHGPRHLTALKRLIAGSAYEDFTQICSLNRPSLRPADRHNLVVLSRLPVMAWRQVWHDLVPPPLHRMVTANPACEAPQPVEWDRPLLHLEISLAPGQTLHLLNLHLRAPRAAFVPGGKESSERWQDAASWAEGFFLAGIKRSGQALEARLIVDALFDADPDALIAVTGDFNATDGETPVRTIRGDAEDTGNPRLAKRTLVGLERALPGENRFSVIHHGRPMLLDHLLVSRALLGCFRGIEAHNETLGDELVSPLLIHGTGESYHAPLVAAFEIPPLSAAPHVD